jgi:hypothetical protein
VQLYDPVPAAEHSSKSHIFAKEQDTRIRSKRM